MEYFFETVETIGKGKGFSHFDSCHIFWLIFSALILISVSLLYKKASEKNRAVMRYTVSALIIADEIFKVVCLVAYGNFTPKYLPLQLCSINVFVIAVHALTRSKAIGNFLYTICLPASVLPLIFPTWTKLPIENFMHIHSFTIHMLLALYPLMLTVGSDIKPKLKYVPACLAVLFLLAGVAFAANSIWDTNFMFLRSASKGNPLYVFKELFGNHLIGYPILIPAVIAAMHLPWIIARKIKKEKSA
ncbi:MAG: hypothetical protein E7477_09715 [Ruminococcaceae bacterium]|nr:hypothetical protein [Oscillospiraceae bacterium]